MPRAPRNRRPDLNGLLVIDKPLGPTSADVCRRVRAVTGGAKVGHAGALDPLATGVLVVCLGAATKAVEQIQALPKRYRAVVDLSSVSPSDDLESTPVPPAGGLPDPPPDLPAVEHALNAFRNQTLQQRPPVFSAVHIGGRRAYDLARAHGADAPRPKAKPVCFGDIAALSYNWPKLELTIGCGKGVYIRSFARDFGASLGAGGMLLSLRREAIGPYTTELAIPLDALPTPVLPERLLPIPDAFGAQRRHD